MIAKICRQVCDPHLVVSPYRFWPRRLAGRWDLPGEVLGALQLQREIAAAAQQQERCDDRFLLRNVRDHVTGKRCRATPIADHPGATDDPAESVGMVGVERE